MERRDFIKAGAVLGAAAAMPSCISASGKGKDRIKVGLIGCGGRATGAATNMMNADQNVEFVAFADLFEDKIQPSIDRLVKESQKVAKVKGLPAGSAEKIINSAKVQRFSGWNCVDQILSMKEIDVIIEATPPVFRTPHYKKIVAAGKHAFLEKPACIDITQAREMLALADEANKKGLSVVCGTQRRYHQGYQEVIKRVKDGMIGDLLSAQCYWNSSGYVGHGQHDAMEKKGLFKGLSPDDMEYQIRNWFSFIWTSGDHIVEQHVHNIDVLMWALGDNRMPLDVRGMGGRSTDLPTPTYGDRFSHFAVDFDMGEGLRIASYCQQDPKAASEVGERIVGSKGIMHTALWGGACKITDLKGNIIYQADKNIPQCMEMEHKFLLDNIRAGKQVNTLKTLVNSTLLAIAGRMSAFSGKKFKFEWMMRKSQENLVPAKMGFYKNPIAGVPVPGKYRLY
ncbi:MAG: Gfo/Idh/MocA family oxidoreductase [Verrucomicrobiaceae bacterium]|nr:Gfo/Idh/MocA family oxidoreductase [Verrucomicrobiaceae bacterium]